MKTMRILAAGAFATLLSVPAIAATDLRVNINLGNAPPPPVFVVQHPPRTVWLPEERVYVVNDTDFGGDDCFQYGGFWFVFHDNYWYRARSWRGPFTVIQPRYVPQQVFSVPARRWKHHPLGGPPGQSARYAEHRVTPVVVDHSHDQDHGNNGRGNGNGNGNGHGKGHK
jgi:hypothetical protein